MRAALADERSFFAVGSVGLGEVFEGLVDECPVLAVADGRAFAGFAPGSNILAVVSVSFVEIF